MTVDRLLGGRVLIEQPAHGFRASVDAVLLAAAVAADDGASVLDAGCGSGAAALCLARRRPDLAVSGLELDSSMGALAAANARRNGLEDRLTIEVGDVLAPPVAMRGRQFGAVMTNPPFNAPGGRDPVLADRARAMVESSSPFAWLAACLKRLAPGGRLVLIHRADRLPAVLAALESMTGAIEIIPLWPSADGRSAKRVLVRSRKGARGPAVLRQGLVLHGPTGNFTQAAEAILRHSAALDDVLPPG